MRNERRCSTITGHSSADRPEWRLTSNSGLGGKRHHPNIRDW
jgi:hypothetical protein